MKELMNGGNQVCAVSNNVSVSDTSDNKSVTISKVVNSKCTVECGEECSLLIVTVLYNLQQKGKLFIL